MESGGATALPVAVKVKNSFSIENILSKPDRLLSATVYDNNNSSAGPNQFHCNSRNSSYAPCDIARDNYGHFSNDHQPITGGGGGDDFVRGNFAAPDSSCGTDDIADTCSDVASEESNCKF